MLCSNILRLSSRLALQQPIHHSVQYRGEVDVSNGARVAQGFGYRRFVILERSDIKQSIYRMCNAWYRFGRRGGIRNGLCVRVQMGRRERGCYSVTGRRPKLSTAGIIPSSYLLRRQQPVISITLPAIRHEEPDILSNIDPFLAPHR